VTCLREPGELISDMDLLTLFSHASHLVFTHWQGVKRSPRE
jgi:hypothetical protein